MKRRPADWAEINRQIDLLEMARLDPGVDWRIVRRFGTPTVEIQSLKAANRLMREVAKRPWAVHARCEVADEMLAVADEQPSVEELAAKEDRRREAGR